MNRESITAHIYLLAAAATSWIWIRHANEAASWQFGGVYWLLLAVVPLLFVSAYSRSLLAAHALTPSGLQRIGGIHAALALLATFSFAICARYISRVDLPEDVDWLNIIGWLMLAFVLAACATFFVAALFLLLRRKSSLGRFASFLFWAYWLLIALALPDRHFNERFFDAALCFVCFLAPVFLAIAAGAILHRPKIAHAIAVAGVVALPWIYTCVLRGNIYVNEWIVFNVPDRELRMYKGILPATVSIISVALLVLALATAAFRLLPDRAAVRGLPLSCRTWPAFFATLLFLAIWFGKSVTPYRIPGAVDYSRWPILQILHVEKRGLQFHETCVRVWGYRGVADSLSFSSNDRRLFEYRFQQRFANAELSQPLRERIAALIHVSKTVKSNRELIKPLRRWNDEGWYVTGEDVDLQVYTKGNGSTPPQEMVDLFYDLDKLPRTRETSEDRKDVCLGFCYDPPAGLGALYANDRCRYDMTDRDYVCQ